MNKFFVLKWFWKNKNVIFFEKAKKPNHFFNLDYRRNIPCTLILGRNILFAYKIPPSLKFVATIVVIQILCIISDHVFNYRAGRMRC